MKVIPEKIGMTTSEREIATKLAAARWMAEYDATEKSFYRIRRGLRESLINKAFDVLKAANSIGLNVYINDVIPVPLD